MQVKRGRFLSHKSPSFSSDDSTPAPPTSPFINNLNLPADEDIEDLQIAPSDEYEAHIKELSTFLQDSDVDDNFTNSCATCCKSSQLTFQTKSKGSSKKRAYSVSLVHSKVFIFDILMLNNKSC